MIAMAGINEKAGVIMERGGKEREIRMYCAQYVQVVGAESGGEVASICPDPSCTCNQRQS